MWETRIREHRTARWRRFAVVVVGGALLLVLGLAPGAHAAPVDFFSINDVSITEGDAGTANLTFTISYTGTLNDISVDWATADNTASAGADYTASSGTASFTAASGSRSRTITVPVRGDLLDEANETFFVNLTNPLPAATAAITDAQGIGTITDNDPLPAIAIDDPPVTEGDSGTATMTYTVSLAPVSGRSVTVNYTTANGTATQPADYTTTSGALTFTAGQTTRTIAVPVAGDTLDEANETVLVNLSGATNATIADAQGVGTITDDDPLPQLSINDLSLTEGNSGTANITFTVTLTPVSGRTATVGWATADGSATAPADYTAGSGTVTFTAGQTTRTFTVAVRGDTLDELDETFAVNLSSPSNATIADAQGVGTIVDNDATPNLRVNDVTVTEGNGGTTTATFTVTLSAASGLTVMVDHATADGTATGPADYQATSGTLMFTPGQTTQTVSVPVVGDLLDEANETYNVNLTNPTNATIADNLGVGTITDDDPLPAITIDDPSVTEGDSGTSSIVYTVTLSPVSGRSVTVNFATANGTATQPGDYTSTTGSLTFTAGQTTRTIAVPVAGDTLDEANETVLVNLSGATNATIADAQGVGTITDDDPLPQLTINDVSLTEGNSGTSNLTFTVTLAPVSGRTVTAAWATADGSATAPADYTASSGTVTFTAGQTTRTFTVPVVGDTLDELNETFVVNLSSPTNATIVGAQGVGTIVDNDATPNLRVNDVTVTEGDTGTTTATFTVTLSAASGLTVTVDHATSNGTATAPADYAATSGTLTFAPGQTTRTIDVAVAGDLLNEANETYNVNLSNPTNATIADNLGVGTITNDDPLPGLSIDDPSVTEGDSGTSTLTFTVSLSAPSGRAVSVTATTANGTATQPADYASRTQSLVLNPGETSRTFAVTVNGDLLDEADADTVLVNLTAPTNATIVDAQGVGTILDDDPLPALSIADASVAEGDAGPTGLTLTVTLAPVSGRTVTVDWASADGTAHAPGDYAAASGTLTFAAGQSTRTVTVPVTGDTVDEFDETILVALSAPANARLTDDQAVATIVDDDAPAALSVDDVTVTEGNTGTTTATFTVSLSAASGKPITVDHATADGTAVAGPDFTAGSGTLAFAPGDLAETVDVAVSGDTLDEFDETLMLLLSNPANATILDGTGVGTIVDDDLPPTLSIGDLSVPEGDAGTSIASVPVMLSAVSGKPITVDVATADGTATAGSDYVAASGTLTLAPGQAAATADVTIEGDRTYEADEDLTVSLTNEANAVLADGTATLTIVDDDPLPAISIDDVTVDEGDAGDGVATFTLSLSNPSAFPITVDVATAGGTASPPNDFDPVAAVVAFAPGEVARTVDVTIHGDTVFERDEAFTVGLANPAGATVADASGDGTIRNDDAAPVVDVFGVTVGEGDAGDTVATFTLTLSGTTDLPASVDVATADGTASAPADHAGAAATVTFAPGDTTETVDVAVHGDTMYELDEDFVLQLSAPVDAAIGTGAATGTILNDDPLPTISITDTLAVEGNAGTSLAAFALSLSNPSAFPVSVDAATADGSATSPADYTAAAATVTFAPGDVVVPFDVLVNGDGTFEGDETFTVTLSNPSGGTLGTATATGTIVDDEAQPVLSIDDVTVAEGNVGTTPATFTVSVSAPSGSAITVDVATAAGTAGPDDYASAAAALTITPGATSAAFTVDVIPDRTLEPDETFTVGLSNAVGAAIGDASGVGTITNDDSEREGRPSISVGDVRVLEGDHGTSIARVPIWVVGGSDAPIVAMYASLDGTATGDEDFATSSGMITILPGTQASIAVAVLGDRDPEADETFEVTIVSAAGATAVDRETVTIVNDDRTGTRMSVHGRGVRGSRVAVRGRLVASRTGLDVHVALYRLVDGRWAEIASTEVSTIATARRSASGSEVTIFRARFRHLEPGRYLTRATFDGDELNAPSHARDRFRLR